MPEWRTTLKLKFPGIPRRRVIGFRYEYAAWLIAYDLFGVDLDEFSNLDADKQITAIHYGAAVWDRVKLGKGVYFTYEEMVGALSRASKAENIHLAEVMSNAQFPEWMSKLEKKKVSPEP